MQDIAVSYNKYKFIGNEFLTWLWFMMETDPDCFQDLTASLLIIGNRIQLENTRENRTESITIKGDDAGLEEGKLALQKGAQVTEMNLSVRLDEFLYKFTLKGESLSLSNLKLPDAQKEAQISETDEDFEATVLDRMFFFEKIISFIDAVYERFIRLRISDKWKDKVLGDMKRWIMT